MNMPEDYKRSYTQLWQTMAINLTKATEINTIIKGIKDHRGRYQETSNQTQVPWILIGILHAMEASGNFTQRLQDGAPIDSSAWVLSAIGILKSKFVNCTWNSIEEILYNFECWNGLGYRKYHPEINSPYLWSYTNHYIKGKYAQDNKFDPELVSRQPGAAVLLKVAIDEGLWTLPTVLEIKPETGKEAVLYAIKTIMTATGVTLEDLK